MKVEKVINNNLVRSYDHKGQEVLVMGCGLGFKKVPGDDIDEAKIEKLYTMSDHDSSNKLETLLSRLPLEYIQVANEIIDYAKISLAKKLSDNIYITLTDHISFALQRHLQGVVLQNALLWEIKRFYNHEYLIGKEALNMIDRTLHVRLPEDEAGFIALHLVNASLQDSIGIGETAKMMEVIQDIINIIKYHFHIEFNESSLHYERFITHLKFFVQRVFLGNELNGEDKNFLTVLKEQYKKEYLCTLKIKDYMQKEYNHELTEDEMIYLTIHIRRITSE